MAPRRRRFKAHAIGDVLSRPMLPHLFDFEVMASIIAVSLTGEWANSGCGRVVIGRVFDQHGVGVVQIRLSFVEVVAAGEGLVARVQGRFNRMHELGVIAAQLMIDVQISGVLIHEVGHLDRVLVVRIGQVPSLTELRWRYIVPVWFG